LKEFTLLVKDSIVARQAVFSFSHPLYTALKGFSAMSKFRFTDVPARAINKFRRHFSSVDSAGLDSLLADVPGVIHIGANTGQERAQYAAFDLNVLWIEPIPEIFESLCSNISTFPKQQAIQALLAAEHGREYVFHVSDNQGASSSILDFAEHRKLHPDIHYTSNIRMTSTTLTHLIDQHRIDINDYGALILDTQGSELLVLNGATSVLPSMRYLKTEVADFEAYKGCCRVDDLSDFMTGQGFKLSRMVPVVRRDGIGTYYEAIFGRA
jgi:FkbM family methyltransferase